MCGNGVRRADVVTTTMNTGSILLISRGDLPSLTAAVIQGDFSRLILWHVLEPDVAARRRREAVRACGEVLGVKRVVESEAPVLGMPGMAPPGGLYQSHLLLHAIITARQLHCAKIVWPIAVGPDPGQVGEAVERAGLAVAAAELPSAAGGAAMIDLPLVDLTDEKLVELVDDCGGPAGAFWPCEGDAERPCGQCPECRRWEGAFGAVGIRWPWVAATPA